jgi:hypothetical protein
MPTGPFRAIMLASMSILLAACAASTRVAKTYSDDAYANSSFNNFLVIGVAGNYNSRAQFERTVVSGLRAEGASASAYYSVVQGNEPISRDAVLGAVQSGNFDAVLVTRVISQQTDVDVKSGSAGAKATTIGGSPINFFRYNYEELNEPQSINFNTTVVLETELFSSADEKMIWAIQLSSTDAAGVGVLIDNTATSIVSRLRRDGLISR